MIFDTAAASDNYDYDTVSSSSSYYIVLSVGNDVFLPPSLSLSFPRSLWGAFV